MTAPPAANLGLCATCRWARRIESARGPHFLPGCWGLRPEGYHSDLDAAYPRYPLLPVQACTGFEVLDPSFPLRHNSGEGAEG